jgi:hypothetical protein
LKSEWTHYIRGIIIVGGCEFLWSTNSSYWLQHLLGTSFYNSYLRLCGDKIGYDIDIYTTLIGAP